MAGNKTASLFAADVDSSESKKPKVRGTLTEDGKGNYCLTFPKHHNVSMIRETENGNPYVTISGPAVELRFSGTMPDGKGGTKDVKDFPLTTSPINFRLNL